MKDFTRAGWVIFVGLLVGGCDREFSDAAQGRRPIAKDFCVQRGSIELRGRLRPLDDLAAEAEIVLEVHNPARNAEALYRYRERVELEGDVPLELGMRERRMYALLPRRGLSWRNLLTSASTLADELDLVRLDGAGEED
jgi:hypothetical protein